jgi:hypothetical protein
MNCKGLKTRKLKKITLEKTKKIQAKKKEKGMT